MQTWEVRLRHALILTTLISGGFGLFALPASAGPLPSASAYGPAPGMVEHVANWRRYCKFHDCAGPNVAVTVDAPPPVVDPDNPAIIAIVPIRPVSCGEFHYWNGAVCVDARYNKVYVGPR
jgi:hypothetical protein